MGESRVSSGSEINDHRELVVSAILIGGNVRRFGSRFRLHRPKHVNGAGSWRWSYAIDLVEAPQASRFHEI